MPTVAPASEVQIPLSAGVATMVGKRCCAAGAGMTAGPIKVVQHCRDGAERP